MSKQIDWTEPVTGEDREWAKQFPGLHSGLIEASDATHGEPVDESLAGSPDEDVPYTEWSLAELQAEIRRRNKEEDTQMAVTGKKEDLVARLEEDDAARAA